MKCSIDTSALRWLNTVGRLNLLPRLYSELNVPLGVYRQISRYGKIVNFVEENAKVLRPTDVNKYQSKLNKLTESLKWPDPVDVDVLLTYQETDSDEMLFSNKEAERRFVGFGIVRDVYQLYSLAERKGIYSRQDSLKYIRDLLKFDYRRKDLTSLLEQLLS